MARSIPHWFGNRNFASRCAHEIKSRREHEWEPPGHDEVIPARSAAHRDKLEEAQKGEAQMLDEDETDLRKPEEEKKEKKRRRGRKTRSAGSSRRIEKKNKRKKEEELYL